MEGLALFQFDLTKNGEIKSTTFKNDFAKTFMWMFEDGIRRVPNYLFMTLIKVTSDSSFVLPVQFRLGNSLGKFDEHELTGCLQPIVVRAIGYQRRRIRTTHGDIVPPGAKGTYYDLKEAIANKPSVLGLSLVRKELLEVPKQIEGLTAIKYFDFEGNSIANLPDFIGELKELEEVYLYKNKITTTPSSLSKLTKLRNLVLANNLLNSFPNIGDAKNLELLDLSNNKINKIPPEIITLTKLRFLYLDNNDIKSLPVELFQLPNLERLYLQGNPLTEKDISLLTDRLQGIEIIW
jgi:hypothetical protein